MFLAKYFYQYFKWSPFVYAVKVVDESYQFFQTYKRFDKEEKKHTAVHEEMQK